jgi:hypothetical protein
LVGRAQNRLQHAFCISQDIVVPKSENEIAHGFERFRPAAIALLRLIVLPAIDLHDELCVRTIEIDNESIYGSLPLELPAAKPAIAHAKPQHALRVRLIAT